ncbi:MAG: glutamate--tRNA ligase [Anaerolineaceae bacterium]|nr:glutamate--tRNA ligase [Anaerolineaceae bacterium]
MAGNEKPVRVRIAPSPTGDPHVGTAYIALFNLCFARHSGGKFLLRIEDTDRARSTPQSEQAIFEALHWLGLDYDEGPDVGGDFGPYRQSERSEIYKREIRKLLDGGQAYYCFCTPERLAEVRRVRKAEKQRIGYDRHCRDLDPAQAEKRVAAGQPQVVRLAVPLEGETAFHDMLRGAITFQNAEIDDQVLLKSDGFPTYHLANVVDDHLMQVTHVCRAEEWITSTPKHVLLYEAFGWEPPEFVHMPLLRNKDRSKISKRKNPTSLCWYRDQGYLPAALLNFLGLMGYSMPDGREVFSLGEMIDSFSWERVATGGPIFDLEKLDWLNGEYIRSMPAEDFVERLIHDNLAPEGAPREKLLAIAPMVQQRVKRLSEVPEATAYFWQELPVEGDDLLPKKKKGKPTRTADETRVVLEQVRTLLEQLPDWTAPVMETAMRAYCEESEWKVREVFMSLRVAVTGRTVSAPLFETMEVLGRRESMTRLDHAIAKLA